ncbi:hypothetical protein SGGMMB4_04302 [Sodalis glossinidius str. 'morsitans']|uniref:Uncharacterized protein n=1 Tax=Sodalis glossinidius (strain morsitans) TaxID=343509 RepID=A0A193QLS9_SODGM|nr:hypothetical protein SGGMMB4_04302 [Sodalis glossinidius str. 'morsitans']
MRLRIITYGDYCKRSGTDREKIGTSTSADKFFGALFYGKNGNIAR